MATREDLLRAAAYLAPADDSDAVLEAHEADRIADIPPIRMPLTLVDNEDRAARIPGQPGYAEPGQ